MEDAGTIARTASSVVQKIRLRINSHSPSISPSSEMLSGHRIRIIFSSLNREVSRTSATSATRVWFRMPNGTVTKHPGTTAPFPISQGIS